MSINEIISAYVSACEEEKRAKKRAEEMKKLILSTMGNDPIFETDLYSVIMNKTVSSRIDTKALYADFPDIKETYGKPSISVSLTIAEKSALKTA